MKFFYFLILTSLSLLVSCNSKNSETVQNNKSTKTYNDTLFHSDILDIIQISKNCFVHVSYLQTDDFGKVACNGLIVRNEKNVVILDTPTSDFASVELINFIEEYLKCTVKGIVPTHFHKDCIGGLKTFEYEEIRIFISSKTVELIKKEDSVSVFKFIAFEDSLAIRVGAENLILKYPGPGHTSDNIVAYYAKDKILFGGCLIKELGAYKGYLGDAEIGAWSNSVRKVKSLFPEAKIIVPGHGKWGDKSLLDYTITLFKE